mgnify:CR=1 FL=1
MKVDLPDSTIVMPLSQIIELVLISVELAFENCSEGHSLEAIKEEVTDAILQSIDQIPPEEVAKLLKVNK